ncbi:MAG: 30S ribosomal protein S3ae [Candidatus Thermoplasmatota archaeon]|nr:30S ribosomal protein S3ae [Candidatus Thermoplasmatota archaeon]
MAKARSRTAARKIKDKWKAKTWYNILAPSSFDKITIADTLSDNPNKLINRVTEVSLQDLTNDFRKSHIKLFFKINKIEDTNALTQFIGHELTSDYLRRMIRRKRSKIDGVYDVTTIDGAVIRVKPFATTDKRIQNSQRKVVRETMKQTIYNQSKTSTLSEFIQFIIDGKLGSEVYKKCKKLYPVKRVEVNKTQVLKSPTIQIEDKNLKKEEMKEENEKQIEEIPKKTEKKKTVEKKKSDKSDEKTKTKKTSEKKEKVVQKKKDDKEKKVITKKSKATKNPKKK